MFSTRTSKNSEYYSTIVPIIAIGLEYIFHLSRLFIFKISWLLLLLAASAAASDTTLLFKTKSYNVGPFPSDSLTKSDSTQKTGLTVTLPPPPECNGNPGLGSCANNQAINQLDGFNPNPRLTLCFSGSIDLSTVTKAVFLAPVSSPKTTTTVNQLIFDPAPGTNCFVREARRSPEPTHAVPSYRDNRFARRRRSFGEARSGVYRLRQRRQRFVLRGSERCIKQELPENDYRGLDIHDIKRLGLS